MVVSVQQDLLPRFQGHGMGTRSRLYKKQGGKCDRGVVRAIFGLLV